MGRVSNQTQIFLCIIMRHPCCGSISKINIMSSFISSNLPAPVIFYDNKIPKTINITNRTFNFHFIVLSTSIPYIESFP